MALADRLSTADSLPDRKRATDLLPGDSRNWFRLAILQQSNGISSITSLTQAAHASPLDADAWIGIALERELSGDSQAAEQNLLHAAEVSHEYVPRWALLNFYFRRNDAEHFWPWAKQALTLGAGDLQPIFRMAWALSDNAGQIDRAIPDRPTALSQYLGWLTSAGKLDAAEATYRRLLPRAGKEELPTLERYCDRQLSEGHFAAATAAWNGMATRHLLTAVQVPTASGIVDGEFTREPLNSGFDWRVAAVEGAVVRPTLPGLRVTFSGKQPEICEPVFQYVPLGPNRRYELTYEYFTNGIPPRAGLSWRVFDAKTGVEFTKDPPSMAHDQPVRESFTFATPSGVSGARLALAYRRSPGTTRIEGWLQLKRVALRAAD